MKAKPHVRILADNEEHSTPYLLRRGDPVGFGDPVEPGVPTLFQSVGLKPYAAWTGAYRTKSALIEAINEKRHDSNLLVELQAENNELALAAVKRAS